MKKPLPFGKYYLLERINVGGMAEVFKAKSFGVEGFERIVAVKRILASIAEDQEFITMFIDEAKVAVQLTHANIAQIFDLGKVGDSYFIAMEYVPGRDLRAIFDKARKTEQPIPVPMACYTVMKVCEGLDYAHNKKDAAGRDLNLVHRDVSPQNVLISYDGEVKIIDFGIAKAACRSAKTQAGILKGKFGYMSPEQVRGLPLDRRSDIFSVGIVLYELLTLERLFQGESDFSTLEKVRNVEIMPPSTYNPRIPEELEQIVLKALSKEVEDRYQTAMDLHDDLQSFMYTSGNFFARKDLAVYVKTSFPDDKIDVAEEQAELKEVPDKPPAPREKPTTPASPPTPAAPPLRAQPPIARGASAPPLPPKASAPPPPPRASAPPPPPRASAPPPPPRSAPPPPPGKEIKRTLIGLPSPPSAHDRPSAPSSPAAAPQSPSAIGEDLAAGRVVTPLGESPISPRLEMEWDDEELATQVYDKPSDFLSLGFGPSSKPPLPTPPVQAEPVVSSQIADQRVSSQHPLPNLPPPQMAPPTYVSPSQEPPAPYRSEPPPPSFSAPPYFEAPMPSVVPRTYEKKRKGNGVIIALSILIVMLLVGGVALFVLMSRPTHGSIGGFVRPPTAQVFIDSRPVAVNPDGRFNVENIRPGTREVRAQADGFPPVVERVVVTAGNATPVALLLEPVVPPPPPLPIKTGVAVLVQPDGASIYVNDIKRDEVTPAEHIELPPGSYAIKVIKEGYLPLTHQATVTAFQVATLSSKLRPEWITFEFTTPQDRVKAYLAQSGLPEPEKITDGHGKAQPHRDPLLIFKGRGLKTKEIPLLIPEDGALALNLGPITLEEEAEKVRPPSIVRPPPLVPPPTPITPPPTPPPQPPPPTTPPTKVLARGEGTLSIQTVPWTKVYINGRYVRTTPLMGHKLPSGRYRVNLVNEDFGIQKTITVNIEPGAHVKNTIRFNE